MSSASRDRILSRLRRATDNSLASDQTHPKKECATPDLSLFEELLNQNKAEVIHSSVKDLPVDLDAWFAKQANTRVEPFVCAEHAALADLSTKLGKLRTGISLSELTQANLFDRIATSICYAECGVADKGALLLKASANQPRTLSLIPSTNIIVVHASNVFSNLASCFASEHFSRKLLPSNSVFISGPSKTADIQQTLAYGAHGPKRLVVFILGSANNA